MIKVNIQSSISNYANEQMTHRLRESLARLGLGPEEHVELLGDGGVPAQRRAQAGRRSRVH